MTTQQKQQLAECRTRAQQLANQHQGTYRVSMTHSGRYRVDSHVYLEMYPDLQQDLCVVDDFKPQVA